MPDVNLLVVQQHAINGLDSGRGSLSGLIMNETISFGATMLVCSDFTGKNVAECSESVMKCLWTA